MDPFVKHNLQLMTSSHPGGMQYSLQGESVGGNAGSWRGLSCAATHFSFQGQTGVIAAFGNPQDIPREFRHPPYEIGTFRVALDFSGRGKVHIVEFFCDAALSAQARQVLDWSIREYNQVRGF